MNLKLTILGLLMILASQHLFGQSSTGLPEDKLGTYMIKGGKKICIGKSDNGYFLFDYKNNHLLKLEHQGSDHWQTTDGHELSMEGNEFRFQLNKKHYNIQKTDLFETEPVAVENDDVSLRGILWKPLGQATYPVIILVHGAGPETRYGMRYLPYYLVSLGYGVVTYDKRGTGESTGKFEPWFAGIDKLSSDARAVFRFLKEHPQVEKNKIGMMGISNGAWVVTRAASKLPDLKFILPVVGGFVPIYQQELYRMEMAARDNGLTEQETKELVTTMSSLYSKELFSSLTDSDAKIRLKQILDTAEGKRWKALTPLPQFDGAPLEVLLSIGRASWNNELSYDPTDDLKKTSSHIVAILGEHDQVSPAQQIKATIEKSAYRSKCDVYVLAKTQHYLRLTGTDQVPISYLKTLRRELRK